MSRNIVTAFQALESYRARVTFADAFSAELDLEPAFRGPAFAAMDEREFRKAQLQFDTVCWPGGADIAPETLRFWCERGGVTSPDEAETYFRDCQSAARIAESAE